MRLITRNYGIAHLVGIRYEQILDTILHMFMSKAYAIANRMLYSVVSSQASKCQLMLLHYLPIGTTPYMEETLALEVTDVH